MHLEPWLEPATYTPVIAQFRHTMDCRSDLCVCGGFQINWKVEVQIFWESYFLWTGFVIAFIGCFHILGSSTRFENFRFTSSLHKEPGRHQWILERKTKFRSAWATKGWEGASNSSCIRETSVVEFQSRDFTIIMILDAHKTTCVR